MLRHSLCVLLFILLSGRLLAADGMIATATKAGQLQLAQEVRRIFEAKCAECHGPDLTRPKGRFGYVLDLKRVADNPDYIVRGDAEGSELYDMILHEDMPGQDADTPPLTDAEKASVKRWIEVGAPHELPAAVVAAAAVPAPDVAAAPAESAPAKAAASASAPSEPAAPAPPMSASIEPPKLEMPLWKRTIRWIGRFHPLSTHFPVALMYIALVAEALAWWTRRDSWLQTVRFLVFFGAGGSLVAAGLGWVNAFFTSYVGESANILLWHRWLGTFTALWATACAVLSLLSECREGSPERLRFRGALIIGAVLVGISGFLGSALIYGLDHYSWS